MSETSTLSPNTLAFIGLSNEYCQAVENAANAEREDFVAAMTRLLPRLYIAATDLRTDDDDAGYYIDDALDEDSYNSLRSSLEMLLGEHDTYLEVFEEDMKYSDTPIAASIAEGLCDIFQVMYNFLEAVRNSTEENILSATAIVKDDFRHYWSRTLCNVLRAINNLRYSDHD